MNILVLAGIASFVGGAIGYIIVQFWIRPIWRYTKLKRQIEKSLQSYVLAASEDQATVPSSKEQFEDRRLLHRLHATQLTEACHDDIPHWYRILLQSRLENPLAAAEHLMNLSNIRNPQHAAARIEQVKDCLKF